MTDLLSKLRVQTKCSKYIRKFSATLLIPAIPLLTLLMVYKIHRYFENAIPLKREYGID